MSHSRGYLARYRSLGQFIPEGSKSGAAAAAVYVTHKVLPLDHRHFGRLPCATVRAAEVFMPARGGSRWNWPTACMRWCRLRRTATWSASRSTRAATTVAGANAFVRALHDRLRAIPASRCS